MAGSARTRTQTQQKGLQGMGIATRLMAAGMFASLAVLSGCGGGVPAAVAPPTPEVTVSKPEIRQVTDYFEFPGQVMPVEEVEVRARVTGYLMKVNFIDGQNVKKGDLLYEIDPRPYQAALERAKGELARDKALMDKAKLNVARSERLKPSGAVSEDEYEQHIANLAVLKGTIQSAEGAVRDAELNLEFTKVVSPIDGRVSRTRITVGNLVQVGSGDGTVLTSVVSTNPVYVYFDVDERTLLRYNQLAFKTGQDMHPNRMKDLKFPVEIGLGSEQGFPHAGILDFADNRLDRTTGTIRVRGIFENPKEYLTPGLYVRVRIPYGDAHEALLVDDRAINTDQKLKFLLTVNKDNMVEYRRVAVGRLLEGLRVIESGLKPDDQVVVKGLQRARPGSKVQPVAAEKPATATAAPPPADQTASNAKTTSN
jgi:membrane fusion protein, multidrug efflux system